MYIYLYIYIYIYIYIKTDIQYPISNMEAYPCPTHPTPCPPRPLCGRPQHVAGWGGIAMGISPCCIHRMCIYIYIYIYVCIHMFIYLYIERDKICVKSVHLVAHSPNSLNGKRHPFLKRVRFSQQHEYVVFSPILENFK